MRLDARAEAPRASGAALPAGLGGTSAARLAAATGQPTERIGEGRASLDLTPTGRRHGDASAGPADGGTAGRQIARVKLPELPTLPGIPRPPAMPRLPEMPALPEMAQIPDLPSPSGVADTARRAGAMGVDVPPQVGNLLGAASGGSPGAEASGGATPGATPNVDDIYEGVIERLRRDLIVERERMGDLLGNLGH